LRRSSGRCKTSWRALRRSSAFSGRQGTCSLGLGSARGSRTRNNVFTPPPPPHLPEPAIRGKQRLPSCETASRP
jgi:hypothetical protein